jgi:tape measure domain-containing protein
MLLSQGFDDLASVTEAAAAAADKFGLSQTQANKDFAQVYARLRPLGIELETIRSVYEGFNTAAILSGSSATEASNAFLQLSQALGTGALRGDELRSVFEQTPAVIQAIAKEMNVTVGEIKDLAKEGKVTTEFILPALERLRTEGADKLAEAMKGPAQQFRNLNNAVEELKIAAIADNMEKILELVNQLTDTTKTLTNIINAPGFKFFFDTLYKLSIGPLDKLNQIGELFGNLSADDANDSAQTLKITVTGISEETKKAKSWLDSAFGESMKKKLDEFGKSLNDIGSLVGDSVVDAFKGMEDALVDFVKNGKLSFKSLVDSILEDLARIAIRQSITKPLFNAFSSALSAGLGGSGTSTVRGSIQGSGLNALDFDDPAASLFSSGGYVNRPTLGMIGEGGESELVIPQSKLASAMARYQAGARGGAIVPGGNNANGGGGSGYAGGGNVTVNYQGDVLNFEGQNYVKQSDVGGIISAAANAGEARTMKTLKNSRSQRAMVGL